MELPPEMEPEHDFWPAGCTVADVDDCGGGKCDYCQGLLDEVRRREQVEAGQEPVTDAGDASLAAFAGGQGGD
jgi:hypothetical protein